MNPEEKEMLEIGNIKELEVEPLVDTTKLKPITTSDLIKILGLTIKRDETNKIITFLGMLSAYTEDSQINISFNAPSSTGKSFIPLQISYLFPLETVVVLGGCSPTAFFHDQGNYDKETNTITVDLSRKIIIFLDQPNPQLLEKLRSMLSHDAKEIKLKITDKNQKGGNRTKNVVLVGYPVIIFCTAGLNFDEQEATRFLLLSPEINEEKLREAIHEKIKKESNSTKYYQELEDNPERKLFKDRIIAIKQADINDIKISDPELVENLFSELAKKPKPRHQRDIGRITSLIKVFALLNLWFRDREGQTLIANKDDINEAFNLWDKISESQELNLPPYVLNLYKDVILSAYALKGTGVSRQEIMKFHFEVYNRFLPDWQLRQWIIPMLETSGLITQEADPDDKRKILVYPTSQLSDSNQKRNSESTSGVIETAAEVFSEEATGNE